MASRVEPVEPSLTGGDGDGDGASHGGGHFVHVGCTGRVAEASGKQHAHHGLLVEAGDVPATRSCGALARAHVVDPPIPLIATGASSSAATGKYRWAFSCFACCRASGVFRGSCLAWSFWM